MSFIRIFYSLIPESLSESISLLVILGVILVLALFVIAAQFFA